MRRRASSRGPFVYASHRPLTTWSVLEISVFVVSADTDARLQTH
jgi:hypothetical protein